MAVWPLSSGPTRTTRAVRGNSVINQVSVTAGATAHTKGTVWDEIIASTTEAATAIHVWVTDVAASGAASDTLVDIGIGAATAEQVIIENIVAGYRDSALGGGGEFYLPFRVPAGSRVVARCQSVVASKVVKVGVDMYGGSVWGGAPVVPVVTTYGAVTATSKGTLMTSGGSAHTKGDWSDITTSTSRAHRGLMLLVSANGRVVTTGENWLVDVGIWNGTAYDVLWPDVPFRFAASEAINYINGQICPSQLSLASGSRLGVRLQSSVASSTGDAALYGLG